MDERSFIEGKQADALRLLKAGDVDVALDGYDKLRLNDEVDKMVDPRLLVDFYRLVSSVDGLTDRQKAKATVFSESWKPAYEAAVRRLREEIEEGASTRGPEPASTDAIDWRYVEASSLVGKPAHVSLRGYGFEKYGVIAGTLGLDADTGDVIVKPYEADGFPAGAYFPVGTVNGGGYLKKYDVVQSMDVWGNEPDGFHKTLDVAPMPEDKIMVGEAYDGADVDRDTDATTDEQDEDGAAEDAGPAAQYQFDDLDLGHGDAGDDGRGLATTVSEEDVDDPGLADLLHRHAHFDSLPMRTTWEKPDPGRGPLNEDEITEVINDLSADPEVQKRLAELADSADELASAEDPRQDEEAPAAGKATDERETRRPDDSSDDAVHTGATATIDSVGERSPSMASTAQPIIPTVGWLAAARLPDGSMDCSQPAMIATALGRTLAVIDAGNCVTRWTPERQSDGTCSIPTWEADALTGAAVLAVTDLDVDTDDVDQTAARTLLSSRKITWADGRAVTLHDGTLLFAVMEPSRIEAARTAVEGKAD